MTHIFLARAELLAPGEKMEQQLQWQKEEASTVQEDRKNTNPVTGGLFKGCFKQRPSRPRYAIRDEDDGVDRCPSCSWEIEDGVCPGCGWEFDEDGAVMRPSFGGFSDMDPSERDLLEEEELDGDLELEDHDFAGPMPYLIDEEDEEMADDQSFAVRRWLAQHGAHVPSTTAIQGVGRRRATHSALGSSRQHSYSASLTSRSEDTEMGILEEEDEDDLDEDSSMGGFIDDRSDQMSQITASSRSQSYHPPSTASRRRSARRLVQSETSAMSPRSSQSNQLDEDDDEGGPISNGRRRINHGQARRSRVVLSESDEGSTSTERNAEDRQSLLQGGWSSLDQDSVVGDRDVDDGEESDGGRTTVGWEPTTISNDRLRNAGSLTPTADRPNPSPRPTQIGQPRLPRMPSGLRGLRHRSSIISTTSTANPEEADDDDSEAEQFDRDGDVAMSGTRLRHRVSRARILQSMRFQDANASANTGSGSGNGGDMDSDSTSDASLTPGRRQQRARARPQEYDPRISWMFAQYQTDVREMSSSQQSAGAELLDQMRARTPVSRPRTANRQRQNNQAFPQHPLESPTSPFAVPGLRAQIQANAFTNQSAFAALPARSNINSNGGITGANRSAINSPRASVSSGRPPSRIQMNTNVTSSPVTMNGNRASGFESTNRPPSRNNSRPNSAMGRRVQAPQVMHPQGLTVTPGLNFAARQIRAPQSNPYAMYLPRRQSNQRLQQQPSTATLRARGSTRTLRSQPSQAGLHEQGTPVSPQAVRPQGSRAQLRSPPSQQRIRPSNAHHPRPVEVPSPVPPISGAPLSNAQVPARPSAPFRPPASNPPTTSTGTSRIPDEERLRLARELINRRTQELSNSNPYAHLNRQRGSSVETEGSSSVSSIRTADTIRTNSSASTSSTSVSTSGRPAAPAANRVRTADTARPFSSAWEPPSGAGQHRTAGTSIVNALNSVTSNTSSRTRAEQVRA
ncbi:MAG: hypothetical protein Q9157_003410 [Trypethelium eluteriae]